ncbi:MAG: hypothetical protein ABL998_01420, partial [Planctomycetota bacterium]
MREGERHREVELRTLTGFDEEELGGLASAPPSAWADAFLARSVIRIGALRDPGASVLSELIVGDRETLLFASRRLHFGETLECVVRCPAAMCATDSSLEFALTPFLSVLEEQSPVEFLVPELGPDRRFRLATVADVAAVLPLAARDPTAAARSLCARCACSGCATDLDERSVELVARRMSELDPRAE